MQLLGRLMNHVLHKRGRRATIVGATSGDTGAAAIEAFGGLAQADVFILYPHGRVSDVQRRQMTTVDKPNVHAIAIEGNVRRLPGHRQKPVQRPGVSRRAGSVGRQFDQLGAHRSRRSSITSPAPSLSARRCGASPSPSRPAISATFSPAIRQADGPAGRAAGDRHQRERYSGARAGERRLQAARRQRDAIAVDGHSGLVEFRAPAVRGLSPRRRARCAA